jgi:hypothetical protein
VLNDFQTLFGTEPVGEFLPWLGWVDTVTGTERKMKRTFQALDAVLEKVIDDHRRPGRQVQEEDRRDFVDVLLDVNKNEKEYGIRMETNEIKAIILVNTAQMSSWKSWSTSSLYHPYASVVSLSGTPASRQRRRHVRLEPRAARVAVHLVLVHQKRDRHCRRRLLHLHTAMDAAEPALHQRRNHPREARAHREPRGAIRVVGVCLLCSLAVVHRTVKCFHSLGNSKPYPTQPNDANFPATELQTMAIKISSENHVALNKGSFTNVM